MLQASLDETSSGVHQRSQKKPILWRCSMHRVSTRLALTVVLAFLPAMLFAGNGDEPVQETSEAEIALIDFSFKPASEACSAGEDSQTMEFLSHNETYFCAPPWEQQYFCPACPSGTVCAQKVRSQCGCTFEFECVSSCNPGICTGICPY